MSVCRIMRCCTAIAVPTASSERCGKKQHYWPAYNLTVLLHKPQVRDFFNRHACYQEFTSS